MNFKKIIGVLLGNATPFQIVLSCLLASMLAFIPDFSTAPFLFILLISFMLIFSVNLGLVVIIWIIVKALSFLLVSASFTLGITLLNSFLQPLFQWLINAPLFAFAGFDVYLVTGGQLLGIIIGLIIGFSLSYSIMSLRRTAATLQSNKPAYDKWISKFWVKCVSFLILGQSVHKVDWQTLSTKKTKHPFRITGIIVIVLAIIIAFAAQSALQSKMATHILIEQLEKVNGATVNIASTDINLREGEISLHGLQLADPENLAINIFSASTLTANISITDLLRARLVLDALHIDHAQSGDARISEGKLYIPLSATPIAPNKEVITDAKSPKLPQLNQYLTDTSTWKNRLQQIQRLLNFISGDASNKTAAKASNNTPPVSLKQQANLYGYDNVNAAFLIEKVPTLTISSLTIDSLDIASLPNNPINIQATNLSTEPNLLKKTPTLNVQSKSNDIGLYLKANQIEHPNATNNIVFHINNIPSESIMKSINVRAPKITGGYFNISTEGTWTQGIPLRVNLPLKITLNDSTLAAQGTSTYIQSLPLNMVVLGNLRNPSIRFDQSKLLKEIITSGVQQQLQKKVTGDLKDKLQNLDLF